MNAHLSQTLRELRLSGALDSLEVRIQEATANALPHEQFLELLLQDELMVRKQRKIERHKKAASASKILRGMGVTRNREKRIRRELPHRGLIRSK